MSDRPKAVFDFFETIVDQPDPFKHIYSWRPGAEQLLTQLKQELGLYIIVWTADYYKLIEHSVESFTPGLLGLMNEYYGGGKTPAIPADFKPPSYSEKEMKRKIENLTQAEIDFHAFDGIFYDTKEEWLNAIKKKKFSDQVTAYGLKVPPLVGSNILVDDLVDDPDHQEESNYLRRIADDLHFSLIDPKSSLSDKSPTDWTVRVKTQIIQSIKK